MMRRRSLGSPARGAAKALAGSQLHEHLPQSEPCSKCGRHSYRCILVNDHPAAPQLAQQGCTLNSLHVLCVSSRPSPGLDLQRLLCLLQ